MASLEADDDRLITHYVPSSPADITQAGSRQQLLNGKQTLPPPAILLWPLTNLDSPLPAGCARLILPTAATTEGIRQAYQHLKILRMQNPEQTVGIIMYCKENNGQRARYFYTRLAVAARRFLNSDISSFGYLTAPSTTSEKTILSGMASVAQLLVEDWRQFSNCGRFISNNEQHQ